MQENESFDFLRATDAEFLMFAVEQDESREQDKLVTHSGSLFSTYVEDNSELSNLYPDVNFSREDLDGYELYCIVDGRYMGSEKFETEKEARRAETAFRLRLERKLKEQIKAAFNDLC
jgi:hypothetical protein|tara:strand:+ start:1259 stop:1612 length:354 start_codon:yes stop_codon:yes gene_type:complete